MILPAALMLLAQAGSSAPKPGDWQFGWGSVGIVAGVSVGISCLAWLIMRWFKARERRLSNSPWRLFKDLVSAHELNPRERNLVMRLAQHFRLEQPAMIFTEPGLWEPERLTPAWSRRLPELDKLRRRLFAVR